MEIRTTIRDFYEHIKHYQILPETYIRVIIDETSAKIGKADDVNMLPFITPEEQKCLLSLIPDGYYPDASEELITIIGHSHMNTDVPDMR